MKIETTIDEETLLKLLARFLSEKLDMPITPQDIKFQVSSKVNYKNEWEVGRMRCTIEKTIEF